MQVGTEPIGGQTETLVPIGRGLVMSYERELGQLKDTDMEYMRTWIPRVMVKALALAEAAKIDVSDGTAELILRNPSCGRFA